MVNVGFTEGETTVVIDGLTQWDRGRKLRITDSDLPAAFEVHFAPRACKMAFVVEATTKDGVATVDIPDEALQYGKDIRVYIYIDGKTVKTIVMPVTARPKPEDYVYTPTERLSFADLDKRVDALEKSTGDKVDKANAAYKVYVTDGNGADTRATWASGLQYAQCIPRCDAQGRQHVVEPVDDNNPATKKYVDDAIASLLSQLNL